jgi:dUTP pyrophosphatase
MINTTEIKITKIHSLATIPKYATSGSSGMDLYTIEDGVVYSGKHSLIRLGLKVEILDPYLEFQVRPKSGLALKNGITVLNTPGTIDSDYRGELCVIAINTSKEDYYYQKLQKIAQLVLCPIYKCVWVESDDISDTERGSGGFGSTGLK